MACRVAMPSLRKCTLTRLLSSSAACPVSPLHRLLSAAAPVVSPYTTFAVEDYLVDTCGLTRAQALKASTKLSHLKSPTKPDAVLAFLAGLGLSSAAVAAAVAKDPQLLCAKVEKTLASNVAGLTGLGLSSSEVARVVSFAPHQFRRASIVSKLQYYLHIFGSFENLFRALKRGSYLLGCNTTKVVKPNVTVLQECGLGVCGIAKLSMAMPRMLTTNLERVHLMVACAESLGVPCGSAMFRYALYAVGFHSKEEIAAQVDNLKNTFRWSDAEVRIALSKLPTILMRSKDILDRSEFLISEVGLEPAYIAHRPALVSYSLEGRLRPRYYLVKFLKENGLLDHDRDYHSVVKLTDKAFMEKYIHPYKGAALHLVEDYATACRGEMPTRFRSI